MAKESMGLFIAKKREELGLNKLELSKQLGISNSYLTQLEHDQKKNPNINLIYNLIEMLNLSESEKDYLFDLYMETNNIVSPDISEYLMNNKIAVKALRLAQKHKINDTLWKEFIYMIHNE